MMKKSANTKESTRSILKKYRDLNLGRFITKNEIKRAKNKRFITFTIIAFIFIVNAAFNVSYYNGEQIGVYLAVIMSLFVSMYSLRYSKTYFITDTIAAAAMFFGTIFLDAQGGLVGNSILWLFSIPSLMFFIIEYSVALGTCIAFIIAIFILFCTPINQIYVGVYTENFMLIFFISFLLETLITIYIFSNIRINEIKSKLLTYRDELTGVSNRAYYKLVVNYLRKLGLTNLEMIVVSLDVNRLKTINDTYGHEYGDILIKAAAKAISDSFADAELVSRIGGDEFVIITYQDFDSFKKSYDKIDQLCRNFVNDKIKELTISKGYARSKDYPYINPEKLYIIADQEMYKSKANFYKATNYDRRK